MEFAEVNTCQESSATYQQYPVIIFYHYIFNCVCITPHFTFTFIDITTIKKELQQLSVDQKECETLLKHKPTPKQLSPPNQINSASNAYKQLQQLTAEVAEMTSLQTLKVNTLPSISYELAKNKYGKIITEMQKDVSLPIP